MSLLRAHKILIGTCTVFCLFFAAVQVREYRREGESVALVRAGLALLFDLGLVIYFLFLVRAPHALLPESAEQEDDKV